MKIKIKSGLRKSIGIYFGTLVESKPTCKKQMENNSSSKHT